ncbi:hypothetical protein TPHA_0L00540 [Tetrapisispora phaffii CBS 4417]|uniref:Uncharacterized protein n=1 Tax=Tetrapisispora phaffii (strain ATCC 24235 / CBS 4417 / NBRC 1672 / NRRL Y-8282 / UCD 70-5) TaxID=1071381 RepID=G8BZT2_TETPH|nr:hypothetical protein TPHA_0L00540 [Tetrapisispora phaffii CBS 4417]CCE65410.1 hypothetical protein TPHA_0L00540 [Tetrapisispora phaffii CBS 4417]
MTNFFSEISGRLNVEGQQKNEILVVQFVCTILILVVRSSILRMLLKRETYGQSGLNTMNNSNAVAGQMHENNTNNNNLQMQSQIDDQLSWSTRMRLDMKKSFNDDPYFYFEKKSIIVGTNIHDNNNYNGLMSMGMNNNIKNANNSNNSNINNNNNVGNMHFTGGNPYRPQNPNHYPMNENIKSQMNNNNNNKDLNNGNNLLSVLAQRIFEKQQHSNGNGTLNNINVNQSRFDQINKNDTGYHQNQNQHQRGDPYLNNNSSNNNFPSNFVNFKK